MACRSRPAETILGTWVLPGYFLGGYSGTSACGLVEIPTALLPYQEQRDTYDTRRYLGNSHTPGLMKIRSVLLRLATEVPGRNMTLCSCMEYVRALLHHGRSAIF